MVIPTVLEATTAVFDFGGASATSESRQFVRHRRNARPAASHNPAIQRERAIGDYLLNGVAPTKPTATPAPRRMRRLPGVRPLRRGLARDPAATALSLAKLLAVFASSIR